MKTKTVRISSTGLKHLIHPCDKEYVENVCNGRCCSCHTCSGDLYIPTLPNQNIEFLKEHGADIDPETHFIVGKGRCPMQGETGLCTIHDSPYRPGTCGFSPFTISETKKSSIDKLMVRYRTWSLKCYREKEGKIPIYKAHRTALIELFGEEETNRITAHLDNGGEEFTAEMIYDRWVDLHNVRDLLHDKYDPDRWGKYINTLETYK